MRQMQRLIHLAVCGLVSLAAVGCAGEIGSEPGAPSPSSGERPSGSPTPGAPRLPGGGVADPGPGAMKPFVPDPSPPMAGQVVPGPMPLRRLTRVEYANTVAELFRLGAGSMPALDFPADPRGEHGFALATSVGEVDASRLQDAADAVATQAIKNLPALLPCDPAKGEQDCARRFIETFGRRAFRRALTPAEMTGLLALYDYGRGALGFDFAGAIGQVVRGFIQAPQFMYRWELGPRPARATGQVVRLGPDEIASRLSYFLWSSMPDDALFSAADTGRLATAEDVGREARRMLADPRSRATLEGFHRQWLHLKEEVSSDLERTMDAETTKFATSVFEKGGGLLDKLLLSSSSFVNKALADIYEVTGVTGAALVEQALDPSRRFGVFTQASFLTATGDGVQSHPVRRGLALFEQLMCGKLPPQPANVPAPEALKAGQSNRERYTAIAANPCAGACHGILNPLGFAFENYDGRGKFRTADGGKPVDANGTIVLDGQSRSFVSARELMPMLAASTTVRDCIATQWTRFALGRAELPTEDAALAPARAAFMRSQYDLRELVIGITQTSSFLNRTPAAMETITQ